MATLSLHDKSLQKILILQTAFIGDVVLTTPLIRAVKTQFPNAAIHFVTIPNSENLIESNPLVDKLWIFDKRGKDRGNRGLLRFARLLRQQQFDMAIVPHRSLRSALLVYLANIPIRIGFERSSGRWLFTQTVKYQSDIHEVERNLNLLGPLNSIPDSKILPEIFSTQNDKMVVENWLRGSGLNRKNKLICFAPGSVWPTKRWPAKYWGELANYLQQQEFQIILIGSDTDHYLLSEMEKETGFKLKSAMGKFTLRQTTELLRHCNMLISNDSSPTHLGVAARIPVLTIFGSTIPDFGFFPYGNSDRVAGVDHLSCRPCTDHGRKRCPIKHFRCMLDLKPELILKIVQEMINETFSNKSAVTGS